MSEGQFGAQGATTTTTTVPQAPETAAADTAKREKRELAKAYEESPGCQGSPNFPQSWSFKFPHPGWLNCRRLEAVPSRL